MNPLRKSPWYFPCDQAVGSVLRAVLSLRPREVKGSTFLAIVLLLSSCGYVRPITRSEYGRNTSNFSSHEFTTEYSYLEAGARVEFRGIAVDALLGPQLSWSTETDPEPSLNLNPRLFWFFDKDSFLHLETDLSLYEKGDSNLFTLFAIERTW